MNLIKILDGFESVLKVICIALMTLIVGILFYAVIMRYIFKMPPAWSMELSRYMFLWMVMFCSALVTRERSHIKMTYILTLMPSKMRFVWQTILRLLMIVFCWVMVQYGMNIFPIVAEASSPTLNISMGYMYISIPIGGALMGIYFLEIIVRSFVEKDWA